MKPRISSETQTSVILPLTSNGPSSRPPDMEPVYYWAADEGENEREAVYVSYNGWVKEQPKSWGNPRHGYRCVKEID